MTGAVAAGEGGAVVQAAIKQTSKKTGKSLRIFGSIGEVTLRE
jgi:hypothetical protein